MRCFLARIITIYNISIHITRHHIRSGLFFVCNHFHNIRIEMVLGYLFLFIFIFLLFSFILQ